MRLSCAVKAAQVGGVAKAWYLDDQFRVCCALPCALSPCPFHSACGRIINNRMPLVRTRILCTITAGAMNPCSPIVLMPCPVHDRTTQAAQYIGLVCNPSPCWPFFQPFRMQQMQKNGLALHSALTLRTHNHPTAAQVHHKPSGQHLRCIACAYAAIWPAAFRLDALSQQTILGRAFSFFRWPFG